MIGRFRAFTGHGFTDPSAFDNWRLVFSAGAIQIAGTASPASRAR